MDTRLAGWPGLQLHCQWQSLVSAWPASASLKVTSTAQLVQTHVAVVAASFQPLVHISADLPVLRRQLYMLGTATPCVPALDKDH
jgi:hypothetical protein